MSIKPAQVSDNQFFYAFNLTNFYQIDLSSYNNGLHTHLQLVVELTKNHIDFSMQKRKEITFLSDGLNNFGKILSEIKDDEQEKHKSEIQFFVKYWNNSFLEISKYREDRIERHFRLHDEIKKLILILEMPSTLLERMEVKKLRKIISYLKVENFILNRHQKELTKQKKILKSRFPLSYYSYLAKDLEPNDNIDLSYPLTPDSMNIICLKIDKLHKIIKDDNERLLLMLDSTFKSLKLCMSIKKVRTNNWFVFWTFNYLKNKLTI